MTTLQNRAKTRARLFVWVLLQQDCIVFTDVYEMGTSHIDYNATVALPCQPSNSIPE